MKIVFNKLQTSKEDEIDTNGLIYNFQGEFELHEGYFNVNIFGVGYLIEN